MAKSNGNHHVTPHPDGGWQILRDGAKRPSHRFATQREAIERARQICIKQKTELKTQGKNCKIRDSNSYGNDPYPPKG
jgi:hypothetical protein